MEEEKLTLKENKASKIAKISAIPVGFTLGTALVGVSALRIGTGAALRTVAGLTGMGLTAATLGIHVLNFGKHQTIKGVSKIFGKEVSNESLSKTANLVKKSYEFTKKQFSEAKSTPYRVFSGEADEKYRNILRKAGLNLPSTRELLKKATSMALAIPYKKVQKTGKSNTP